MSRQRTARISQILAALQGGVAGLGIYLGHPWLPWAIVAFVCVGNMLAQQTVIQLADEIEDWRAASGRPKD
jgi:hypothetical protein